jgi:DNA-binding HxlR family transcriptional regulator
MYEPVRAVAGPKWSLEVLVLIAQEGPINYTDIEDRLQTSSDVVTDRLETLREYNLIERDERSQRDVRYTITEEGNAVFEHVEEIRSLLEKSEETNFSKGD